MHKRITTGHLIRLTPASENSLANNYTKDGGTPCLPANNNKLLGISLKQQEDETTYFYFPLLQGAPF